MRSDDTGRNRAQQDRAENCMISVGSETASAGLQFDDGSLLRYQIPTVWQYPAMRPGLSWQQG